MRDVQAIVNLQRTAKDGRSALVIRAKIDAVMRHVMDFLSVSIPVSAAGLLLGFFPVLGFGSLSSGWLRTWSLGVFVFTVATESSTCISNRNLRKTLIDSIGYRFYWLLILLANDFIGY